MTVIDLFSQFAVAFGIGLLIGIERGWKTRRDKPGSRAAGVRTFTIIGLLGGVIGAVAEAAGIGSVGGGLLFGLSFAAFAGVITVFCREENVAENEHSATTAIAAMLAFALGAYSFLGDLRVAAAAAVVAVGVLAMREDIHGAVKSITWPELRSALMLLAMTFVILPVVPDDPVGPFGGVNPREIWLIAILLAGASFVGYVAVKYFGGTRGVLIASAVGGLVSSTAVMAANARRAAAAEASARLLAGGAMLATAVSIARTGVIVGALNPSMLVHVALPLAAAALAAAAGALAMAVREARSSGRERATKFRNPFDFVPVVGFALFLGALVLVSRAIAENFGAGGAVLTALIAGLGDVDAIAVSMSKLAPGTLGIRDAALAVLAAVFANGVSKAAIGGGVAGGSFAVAVWAMTGAAVAAGVGAWLVGGMLAPPA